MPIFEGGGARLWQSFKAQLEAETEAALRTSASTDPVHILRTLYADARWECGEEDGGKNGGGDQAASRFVATVTVGKDTYKVVICRVYLSLSFAAYCLDGMFS